ncbi:RSRC2 family protein [Megaselia abdita]
MGCHDHRHRSRSTDKDTKYSSSSSGRDYKAKKDHYKDDRKDKEHRADRRDRDKERDRGKDRHRRDKKEEKKEHSKHRSEVKERRRKDERRRSRSRERSRRDRNREDRKKNRRRSHSRSKSPENKSRSPSNPKTSKISEVESPPKQPALVKAFDFSALVESKPIVCPKQPDLPNYYNPSVINANKYTEQIQKRKLLWGNKSAEQSSSQWNSAKFSQDTDGKVQSKFLRLMGVKNVEPPKPEATAPAATSKDDQIKSREDMFSNMQQQYDVARQTTHTMRGYGLGFSSQSRHL